MGVVHTPALAARAAAWLARPLTNTPDGKRSPEGLLELATVWAAIQNQPLPECIRQCQYSERARAVAAYLRECEQLFLTPTSAAMSDTTSKYQIAPAFAGQTFVHESYGKAVTADNLTDEDAEFFIQHGRQDAFIKRGPADSQDEQPTKPTEVITENPVVPQADLDAEQAAHGKTKEALASEKDAHKQTKADLKESQSQVKDLTKQLDKLTKQVQKAADTVADAIQPAQAAG